METKNSNQTRNIIVIGCLVLFILIICCCLSFLGLTISATSFTVSQINQIYGVVDELCKYPTNSEIDEFYTNKTTGVFKDRYSLREFREFYLQHEDVLRNCTVVKTFDVRSVFSGVSLSYRDDNGNKTMELSYSTNSKKVDMIFRTINDDWKLDFLDIK